MKTTIIAVLITLVIGGGAGYLSGKSGADNGDQTKKLADSVSMMKEQSANIQKMAEMMKTDGLAMQEIGTKYKDEMVVSKGKDLEMVGAKFMDENVKAVEEEGTMKAIMN